MADTEKDPVPAHPVEPAESSVLAKVYLQFGQVLEKSGRFAEAISTYRKALAIEPDSSAAFLLLGNSLRHDGAYEESEEALSRALQLTEEADAEGRSTVLFALALNFYDQKAYAIALEYIEDALKLDQNASLHSLKGDCLYFLEREPEALAAFDQAIKIDPKLVQAWVGKAEVLESLGRLIDALGAIDYALTLDPTDELILANKARLLCAVEKLEESVAVYDQILRTNPRNVQVRVGKSNVLARLGRPHQALEIIDQALAETPRAAHLLIKKGQLLSALGRTDEGISFFDRVIELSKSSERAVRTSEIAWAIDHKANVLLSLGKNEEALSVYDQAEELKVNKAWSKAHKAHLLRYLGRFDEALGLYDEALEIQEDDASWILAGKAETLYRMRQYEKTIEYWNKVIRLHPEAPEAYGRRGEAYRYMGRYEDALEDLNHALTINPKIDWFLYQRFTVKTAMDRNQEARADLEAAIKYGKQLHVRMPDNWMHTCNLALYYLTAGEVAEAERLYQEVVSAKTPLYTIVEAIKDLDDNVLLLNGKSDESKALLQEYERSHNLRAVSSVLTS